jgi:hypothetical protein
MRVGLRIAYPRDEIVAGAIVADVPRETRRNPRTIATRIEPPRGLPA